MVGLYETSHEVLDDLLRVATSAVGTFAVAADDLLCGFHLILQGLKEEEVIYYGCR
jgi:hypothetical protein